MSARRTRSQHRVSLPSAGLTVVSLRLRRVGDGGPWPLTRVLTALGGLRVERVGVARALGDRRGVPLVHSQEARWGGHALFLESRHGRDGIDELGVELPPWDDLETEEEAVWRLIDAVAVAADAHFGSIGDGEPPENVLPDDAGVLRAQLRRHLALLLPDWMGDDIAAAGATSARALACCGLVVVTA